jgi:RNA polymerase sigma-70 factor (ECF subfamily)
VKALDALQEAQRTHQGAVSELVAAFREPVFALCLHLTRSRPEAEDAAQETFLAIHQGLAGFRGEAKLSTWVYRIAVRAAYRVRGRHRDSEPLADGLCDPTAGPETNAEAREQTRAVLTAMNALPAEQRVVLALFAVEGLRHGEIAEVLGIPEGTVWSRLHQGRRRLATLLSHAPVGRFDE